MYGKHFCSRVPCICLSVSLFSVSVADMAIKKEVLPSGKYEDK